MGTAGGGINLGMGVVVLARLVGTGEGSSSLSASLLLFFEGTETGGAGVDEDGTKPFDPFASAFPFFFGAAFLLFFSVTPSDDPFVAAFLLRFFSTVGGTAGAED